MGHKKTSTIHGINEHILFVEIVEHFLGKDKAENYIELVENMLFSFNIFRCKM